MEGGSCDLCKYMYLASRETASAFICICKWAVMNAGTAHSWPVTWTDDDLTRYRQKNREIKEISADVRQTACGSVRTVKFLVCVCVPFTPPAVFTSNASHHLLPHTAVSVSVSLPHCSSGHMGLITAAPTKHLTDSVQIITDTRVSSVEMFYYVKAL